MSTRLDTFNRLRVLRKQDLDQANNLRSKTIYRADESDADTPGLGFVLVPRRRVLRFSNDAVKTWPSTPLFLTAAPPAGYAIHATSVRLLLVPIAPATTITDYTNIDATGQIVVAAEGDDTVWHSTPLRNDSGAGLTEISKFLAPGLPASLADLPVPHMVDGSAAAYQRIYFDGARVCLVFLNGSSGDLTGGDADQELVVIFSFLVEPVL